MSKKERTEKRYRHTINTDNLSAINIVKYSYCNCCSSYI